MDIYVYTVYAYLCVCLYIKNHTYDFMNMEKQTGSKQEKEYIKAVYCHPAYLTSMQSTS